MYGWASRSGRGVGLCLPLMIPRSFSRSRATDFFAGCMFAVARVPPVQVAIQPEAAAGKVERRALLAQMDDAGLFPVDLQPQPAADLFADEPPQFAARVAGHDDEII